MKRQLLCLFGASFLFVCVCAADEMNRYFIYDGQGYQGAALEQAARSPARVTAPREANGRYVVQRSKDGHFYIPGSINGFPVVWMVDTGASVSVIPAEVARNAGIKAGLAVQSDTATGQAETSISENNELVIGMFRLAHAKVGITDALRIALLGADALSEFTVTTDRNSLVMGTK